MVGQCVKCKKKLEDGDGCYNTPYGTYCGNCGESKPWLKLARKDRESRKPKPSTEEREFEFDSIIPVGRWKIGGKLLAEYVSKVDYLRRATKIGVECNDPLIIQKALMAREDVHRKIFKLVNVPYHADEDATDESLELNSALDKIVTIAIERMD